MLSDFLHFSENKMAEPERAELMYKIVLAGDLGVGKTSIFQRYDINKFFENKESTFGLDILTKDITVEGKRCKINVWDTAGMERTKVKLTYNYYRRSQAVILVYAIDDMYSLTFLRNWIGDITKYAEDALKFLVGNKIDLADEGSQVDDQLAESFCKSHGIQNLYKVSAKTGAGVKEMFDDVVKMLSKEAAIRDIFKNAFALYEVENENGNGKNGCSC